MMIVFQSLDNTVNPTYETDGTVQKNKGREHVLERFTRLRPLITCINYWINIEEIIIRCLT